MVLTTPDMLALLVIALFVLIVVEAFRHRRRR